MYHININIESVAQTFSFHEYPEENCLVCLRHVISTYLEL